MGITTTGKTKFLNQMNGATSAPINTMGVGTDVTAFAVSQTKLNPTVVGTVLLQALDATFPSIAGQVATYQCTFASGSANFAQNELGLFDGLTNGTNIMVNRIVLGGTVNKVSGEIIIWVITLTQA